MALQCSSEPRREVRMMRPIVTVLVLVLLTEGPAQPGKKVR